MPPSGQNTILFRLSHHFAEAGEGGDGVAGPGGGFGVVTAMEVALYPVKTVYGGNLVYPLEVAGEVFGLGVWGATDWVLRAWLVAVALSYPLAMAIEGWALSREFAHREQGARTKMGAKE